MARVVDGGTRRTGGTGTGGGPLGRAVAVVALLAVAALALQARRGLDWSALREPVEVSWLRVALAVLFVLVLRELARPLLRRLRRPSRGAAPGTEDDGPDGEPVPFWLRVAALLLVLGTLVAVWFLLSAVVPSVVQPELADDAAAQRAAEDSGTGLGPSWPSVLATAGVLLAVLLAGRMTAALRRRREAAADVDEDAPVEAARLGTAVAAARVELGGHRDARAAIVAAYVAMAERLTGRLARSPDAARVSDTPTELLHRAVRSGLVSAGPAARLTDLFREARFSRHPMGEEHRAAAEAALAAVADELSAGRHG